jgi:hypothetical protein
MRYVKCGSKLFDPKAVTAVHLDHIPSQPGYSNQGEVRVVVPGDILVFRGDEAKAVRQYFGCLPATDLLRRDEEATEAVADNHLPGEC